MQDNLHNNNMDALSDSGWSDMKSILDKEMPIAKKSRRPWFFFLIPALILLTGLLTWNLWVPSKPLLSNNTDNAKSNQISSSKKSNTIEQSINSNSQSKINTESKTTIETQEQTKVQTQSQSKNEKNLSTAKNFDDTQNKRKNLNKKKQINRSNQSPISTQKTMLTSDASEAGQSPNAQETKRHKPLSTIAPIPKVREEYLAATKNSKSLERYQNTAARVSIHSQTAQTTLITKSNQLKVSSSHIISSNSGSENKSDTFLAAKIESKEELKRESKEERSKASISLLKLISPTLQRNMTTAYNLPNSDKAYNPIFRTEDFIESAKAQKWNVYIQATAGIDVFQPWRLSKPNHSEFNAGLIISRSLGPKLKVESGLSYYYAERSLNQDFSKNYFSQSFANNFQSSSEDSTMDTTSIGTAPGASPDPLEQAEVYNDRLISLRYEGIDVPLHVRYHIKPKLSVHTGLNYLYYIYRIADVVHSGTEPYDPENNTIEYRQSELVKNYNLEGNVGLSYHPWERFSFTLFYKRSILASPLKDESDASAALEDALTLEADLLPIIELPKYSSLGLSARFRLY